jgi:flagellin
MTVTSLSSLAAGIQRELTNRNARVADSINAIVTGNKNVRASTDVAALSIAVSLQNNVSSLRSASLNVSQASSVLQVADGGAEQISEALDRLNALATQANSGTLNAANREALNREFNQVREEIARISRETNFNGQPLLDGTFDAEGAGLAFAVGVQDTSLNLADLSEERLLPANIDLLTQENAAAAIEAINTARAQVSEARADFGSYQNGLSFAGGAIESAIQNQDAARSALSDADIASLSTARAQDEVGRSAGLSLLAQANRLPANILQLIGS